MKRRLFLKQYFTAGLTVLSVNAGLFSSTNAQAKLKPEAFQAKTYQQALLQLFGTDQVADSAEIEISAPAIAETATQVPVKVDASNLPGVEAIAILAAKNPFPLTSYFEFDAGAQPFAATRLKVGQSMDLIAVVKVGDKLYSNRKAIKVTIGGCGGG